MNKPIDEDETVQDRRIDPAWSTLTAAPAGSAAPVAGVDEVGDDENTEAVDLRAVEATVAHHRPLPGHSLPTSTLGEEPPLKRFVVVDK